MKKNDFLTKYIAERGMQNISKSEYEQIMFYWIVKKQSSFGEKKFENLSAKELYEISDELGIDIAKVKSLVKKMMFVRDEDESAKLSLTMGNIIMNHLNSAVYNDGNLVEISVENPIEFDFVKRTFAENNAWYDSSFSSNILKFPLPSLDSIVTHEELKAIISNLKASLEKYQNVHPELFNGKEIKQKLIALKSENNRGKVLSILDSVFQILASGSKIAVKLICDN
jgi:hypothetical protein